MSVLVHSSSNISDEHSLSSETHKVLQRNSGQRYKYEVAGGWNVDDTIDHVVGILLLEFLKIILPSSSLTPIIIVELSGVPTSNKQH